MSALFSSYCLLALVFGYLLGSVPFGLILTRAAGLGDVRKIGSGNIGATNVLRTGNKGLAAATLLLDGLKGTAAVLMTPPVVGQMGGLLGLTTPGPLAIADLRILLPVVAGLGAFLGHLFPVWLQFKGGKGVATFIGVLIGAHWPAAIVFAVVWLATAAITRLSSLSALLATLVVVVFCALLDVPGLPIVLAMAALVFVTHRANIQRLIAGSEPRIGEKK
jgi:glycerol-3-phosphate acyltransferase PlsY